MSEPNFNAKEVHEHFSKRCFNQAWDLIDKSDRTPEDNEQMLLLSQAALWHWTQRPDCTDKNLSIGYWQLSRIYALLGEAENAGKSGQKCLEKTPAGDPFLMGYAYEALARAEVVAGNLDQAKAHYVKAAAFAEQVTAKDDQELLLKDLKELEDRL
jgi:tetratricopeptide (TPR) repeat protein